MPYLPNRSVLSCASQLVHWGPILALSIIIYISCVTSYSLTLLWPPADSLGGLLHFGVYLFQFYLVMSNYLTACFIGPGFVPYEWKPEDDSNAQYLQYCTFCEGYKPPRSHHCRKCDRCVMKMDHHCPWINTCCGHKNHGFFVYFLLFAPIGCIHSTAILGVTLYKAIFVTYFIMLGDETIVYLSVVGMLLIFFAVGLAVGVVISVGGLFIVQLRSIMRNETGIESWIKEKAEMRERFDDEPEDFIFPYNLGRWNNIREVLTWSGHARGDGMFWPVREGCGQFDLTIEQLKQKKEKAQLAVVYSVQRAYSGSLFPISYGFRTLFRMPCSDEQRLKVKEGDMIKVTRWRREWLYGQLMGSEGFVVNGYGHKVRRRGWVPRKCVVESVHQIDNFGDMARPNGSQAEPLKEKDD